MICGRCRSTAKCSSSSRHPQRRPPVGPAADNGGRPHPCPPAPASADASLLLASGADVRLGPPAPARSLRTSLVSSPAGVAVRLVPAGARPTKRFSCIASGTADVRPRPCEGEWSISELIVPLVATQRPPTSPARRFFTERFWPHRPQICSANDRAARTLPLSRPPLTFVSRAASKARQPVQAPRPRQPASPRSSISARAPGDFSSSSIPSAFLTP